MLAEENPQMGTEVAKDARRLGGFVFIYTEDVDASIKRAEAAGARVTMPATDQFWGVASARSRSFRASVERRHPQGRRFAGGDGEPDEGDGLARRAQLEKGRGR